MTTKKPEVSEAAPKAPEQSASADQIGAIARALVNELVPAMAAMQGPKAEVVVGPPAREHNPAVCHICRQHLKTGCHGKHTDIVCYPDRYPEFGKFFRGSIINGVTYLSNDETHKVPVPENAAPHIIAQIRQFELNEREITNGKTKMHNSGHISHPNPVEVGVKGWR